MDNNMKEVIFTVKARMPLGYKEKMLDVDISDIIHQDYHGEVIDISEHIVAAGTNIE